MANRGTIHHGIIGPGPITTFSLPGATLASCSRVFRAWQPVAESVLYRELITLLYTDKDGRYKLDS